MDRAALSAADFAVLVPLSEAPDRRLRARDLGRFLDWDRSRLSHQIRRMEQRSC
jgi:DNA-binding MarR family transcriptional regulator